MIPFSTLLVQLKKLQLQLTDEGLDLYSLSVIDVELEYDELAWHHQQLSQLVPFKPKHEVAEVALHDYGLLFPTPGSVRYDRCSLCWQLEGPGGVSSCCV